MQNVSGRGRAAGLIGPAVAGRGGLGLSLVLIVAWLCMAALHAALQRGFWRMTAAINERLPKQVRAGWTLSPSLKTCGPLANRHRQIVETDGRTIGRAILRRAVKRRRHLKAVDR